MDSLVLPSRVLQRFLCPICFITNLGRPPARGNRLVQGSLAMLAGVLVANRIIGAIGGK
ncbi:MAG: hypothetical protein HQ567_29955 [Candidatus Nealsonbacteria bacterium]|nr:hypothetical protein [Candidatus Nealsonbacteria bacterium]